MRDANKTHTYVIMISIHFNTFHVDDECESLRSFANAHLMNMLGCRCGRLNTNSVLIPWFGTFFPRTNVWRKIACTYGLTNSNTKLTYSLFLVGFPYGNTLWIWFWHVRYTIQFCSYLQKKMHQRFNRYSFHSYSMPCVRCACMTVWVYSSFSRYKSVSHEFV